MGDLGFDGGGALPAVQGLPAGTCSVLSPVSIGLGCPRTGAVQVAGGPVSPSKPVLTELLSPPTVLLAQEAPDQVEGHRRPALKPGLQHGPPWG